jgi:hypothetical protein
MFHKITKPLLIWFHATWWMVAQKNGVSAKGLQKVLGLGSYQSYLNKNKLGYYLDEYVFRYNRRTSNRRGLLFMRLLEQAVIT